MVYSVVIDPRAIRDVQGAIDFYNEQQAGLGERFESALNKQLLTLEKNPFFRIRYDNVRCLPMRRFPFMIHFTVDNGKHLVIVHAVFHTSRNPSMWRSKGQ